HTITERYIELYEKITGNDFVKSDVENIEQRIDRNVRAYLEA
ncbi:MAG: phosphoribosylaminoimidazolesuccinocarboxamide synthase, partial [Crocinitomicaceae bacterium]